MMHVKNVMELQLQPSGRARSSQRSRAWARGQMDGLVKGARMGMGEVFGMQREDWVGGSAGDS
jgi:hypothetical protein